MADHNCVWLMQSSHQALAGGSMYAVHLPEHIPTAGSLGGPPLPSEFREFAGAPFDMRSIFLDLIHHPEKLPQAMQEMQARFSSANKSETHPPPPSNAKRDERPLYLPPLGPEKSPGTQNARRPGAVPALW